MSKRNPEVGDDYELRDHCIVAYPDGSAATASRSIRLVMPGEYRITRNGRTKTVVVTDRAEGEPSIVMDAPPSDPPSGGDVAPTPPAAPSPGSSDPAPVKQPDNAKEDTNAPQA